jgi:membrane-associated protease RseP (regulator of RpoE activity)
MKRLIAALGFLSLLPLSARADPAPAPDKDAAYLGVLFGPVSEALYDQLPQLPRERGVLVTQVLADSPAEKAGLHRNDILLQYNDQKIRDCEDLVRLLQGDRPDRAVKLTLVRGGKETTADATLAVGPPVKTAQEAKLGGGDAPPGVAKPGGPAAVSVVAVPLERGRLKITIEFYPEGEARLKTVTCEGAPDEIVAQVDKENFPERERSMVQVALKRIRVLNAGKDSDKSPPGVP